MGLKREFPHGLASTEEFVNLQEMKAMAPSGRAEAGSLVLPAVSHPQSTLLPTATDNLVNNKIKPKDWLWGWREMNNS